MKYILTKEDNVDKYLKLSDFMVFFVDYLNVIKNKQVSKDT
jgi:hypothetical protein